MSSTSTTSSTSDVALMERVLRGDERALGAIYDRHGGIVLAVAKAILGRAHDAEEVAEDVFVRLWTAPTSFDSSRGGLRSYLVTMTRSRALDRMRSTSRRVAAYERAAARDQDGMVVSVSAPEPADRGLEENDMRSSIGTALSALNEGQRVAIELAYLRGLSQSEIARELGEPLGTIKTRIRDGMAKLRDLVSLSSEAFG